MRVTYSHWGGVLGAFALGALAYVYMGENVVLSVILGIVGFAVGFGIVRAIENALYKGADVIERKIRSEAVSNEEDLLHTLVIFTTTASLSGIRQAVENVVNIKSDMWSGKMNKTIDSEQGVEWEIGAVSLGEGAVIQLSYEVTDGKVKAIYGLVQHATQSNISPHIKKMLQLRNDVITAFKTADPNVKIEQSRQELSKSK
jgi:hypothetical protein